MQRKVKRLLFVVVSQEMGGLDLMSLLGIYNIESSSCLILEYQSLVFLLAVDIYFWC